MNRRRNSVFITALVFLFIPAVLLAQVAQVGTISGTVKDQTGAVLPGVTIEAKHEAQGFTRSVTADSNGQFRMPALPLGKYTLTATLSGFQTETVRHNLVETEKTTEVPISLKLGSQATIE